MSKERKNRRPSLEQLVQQIERLLEKIDPTDDPHAFRLAPLRRGPKGRSGGSAVEPEDDSYRAFPPHRQ